MLSRILILLCFLCIVNASVVVVITDDAANKELSLDSNCNPQACDQLCRRLGFTGGACVGDKCDCDNFLQRNVKLPSDAANKELSLDSNCNPQACDQLCRRLGFTGGACVGDKCDCDNFLQRNVKLPSDRYKYKTIESVEECSAAACAQVCRKRGFPGGACSDEKCDCDKVKPAEKVKTPLEKFWKEITQSNNFEENQIEPKRKIATCNDANCNSQCILIGYQGGRCYVDYCTCYYL